MQGDDHVVTQSCIHAGSAASVADAMRAATAWKIDATDEEISNLLSSSRRRCCLSLSRLIHFPSGSARWDGGRRGTRSRAAEDIKLPTFDRISDCAGLEFRAGLNGIPFAIRSYSVGRPGCRYISRLFRLRLIRLRGKISIRRALWMCMYTYTRAHPRPCAFRRSGECIYVRAVIPFSADRWICVHLCVRARASIVVADVVNVFTRGEEKLVQPNRLQRFLAQWILDVSGVPPRICGWLEFNASEQQAHD